MILASDACKKCGSTDFKDDFIEVEGNKHLRIICNQCDTFHRFGAYLEKSKMNLKKHKRFWDMKRVDLITKILILEKELKMRKKAIQN